MPQNQPPQSADVNMSTDGLNAGLQLPPVLANLIVTLREDRKALLKDKKIADDSTRDYLAHFFFQRLIECIETLGGGLTETYVVASQSLTETSRMRAYVDKSIAEATLSAADDGSVHVEPDDIETLREALAALGLLLVKKLPDDVEVQAAFNLVTDAFSAVGGDGAVDEDGGDEDEDDDDDGEGSSGPVGEAE